MGPVITLRAAAIKTLVAQRLPVATEYVIFQVLRELSEARQFDGERVRITHKLPNRLVLNSVIHHLLKSRLIRPDPDFYNDREVEQPLAAGRHYRVLRISDVPEGSAEDVCCLIDPFCHVSHLSAMQRYGLTDRFTRELMITRPALPLWRRLRDEKLETDYATAPSDNPSDDLAEPVTVMPLERLTLPEQLRGRPVVYHTTGQQPDLRRIEDSFARITTVGDVFVQMLDRPDLCGGMPHVVETWVQHGESHLESIIRAVEKDSEAIVKVRAGYLLNEVLGIHDLRIDAWTKYAQRGGSRKLDPTRTYIASFSEKWMISVNVESSSLPDRR